MGGEGPDTCIRMNKSRKRRFVEIKRLSSEGRKLEPTNLRVGEKKKKKKALLLLLSILSISFPFLQLLDPTFL